jgi:2-oxoisovalerate dehydrogenase E1 component
LIVDEPAVPAASPREGTASTLLEHGYTGRLAVVSSRDSFFPLGDAARLLLVSEAEIETASNELLGR